MRVRHTAVATSKLIKWQSGIWAGIKKWPWAHDQTKPRAHNQTKPWVSTPWHQHVWSDGLDRMMWTLSDFVWPWFCTSVTCVSPQTSTGLDSDIALVPPGANHSLVLFFNLIHGCFISRFITVADWLIVLQNTKIGQCWYCLPSKGLEGGPQRCKMWFEWHRCKFWPQKN